MKDNFINARKFSSILNKCVFLIPCLVLIGWSFNINVLKNMLQDLEVMNPSTAVLFIICAVSVFCVREGNPVKTIQAGRSLGLLTSLVAVMILSGVSQVQGLAPNTAINFILAGVALFFIDTGKKNIFYPSQLIAFAALALALLAIIEHLYVARSSRLFDFISMPMHTAITFVLLITSILLSRYRTGFVSVGMHRNIGGIIVRRLLPVTIAVPVTVSLLILEGQKSRLYSAEFGTALYVILIILIFSFLLLWNANSLNRSHDERKKAALNLLNTQEELAASETKYRNLIENSGIVMYTSTLNGIVTFASSKTVQLTGYSQQELIGMHFTEFIDQEWLQNVKDYYKKQLKENIDETVHQFCIRTKFGDRKWVEQSSVLIKENNVPTRFQCIVKDISETKEMEAVLRKYEEELVQNQERLQSILDNATSLIYVKDLRGRYLLTNRQFKKILNVSHDDVIGKTDFEFSDHTRAQRYKDSDDEVIRTGRAVELEEIIETADGKHTILIIKFPLLDAQNKIYGISGIATDITERVRYQEQLIEAKKIAEDAKQLEEQFLANMSHEIRTPMNGIQGMTDLLLETQLSDEQKDFATTIKRSSDNLLVIINDILDFSKIQAGKLSLEKIDFNLNEVLENVKAIFKHRIQEKELSLQLTVDEDVPATLNGDPCRLNQVLVNLLGNAIKFTHSGSIKITISTLEKRDEEIIIGFRITDTGIGIAKDKISEIFENFTQASVDTTRKYGGTGLGLAITKQLLEMQNGKIAVESKIGAGTTFHFSIPYNYSTTNTPALFTGNNIKNYRSLFTGKNFLVAEDNEVNQKVIKHVLQKAGGTVDIANNGLEAVSLLKENRKYDLIIMDLQMPEMDGYAATKYIRNVMKLTIPIIAMTASALKDEKSKCLAMGMNDYLSKPFDFSFVYNRISLLLNDQGQMNYEPVAAKSSNDLFDLRLLEEMEDNEYLSEILTLFLDNTPHELSELQHACNTQQCDAVYHKAHKLKSSAGLLQASGLLQILIQTEEAAKARKIEELAILSEQALKEFKNIKIPLQLHLDKIRVAV